MLIFRQYPTNNLISQPMRLIAFFFILSVLGLRPKLIAQDNLITSIWQVTDLEFSYKLKDGNPFELYFGAVFTHEGGYSTTIHGFYNDDNTWVIRFCPSLEGAWEYETFSSVSKLAGQIGTIAVSANTKLDEHGPLLISKNNPQKFAYADGTPYFLLAFELDWLFALDAENNEDIPKTRSIIKEVAANRFNHIVMNVYAYDASWIGDREKVDPKYNFAEPEVFPFGGTNTNPDFSTLNIDFFKHLDRVIAHLDEKEIIAHLMIYVWNKNVNWPDPESEADNLYFDYVVKRYQAYSNLVWDISKEALAYGRDDIGYITRRIDRLRKLDGHNRLLSVHDYGYCNNFPGKVDFISIQNWRPNIYDVMLKVRNDHPGKPIFNIEHGGYEKTLHSVFPDGAYEDPIICLDRNYKCIFAGSYSTYYWQNASWYEVIYEPSQLAEENQPNFKFYKNIASLFQAYNFQSLEPYQKGFGPMALTDHKKVYLFYASPGMIAVTGTVPELKNKKVRIRWFDPFTGKFHGNQERTFDNGTWLGMKKHQAITAPISVAVLEVIE